MIIYLNTADYASDAPHLEMDEGKPMLLQISAVEEGGVAANHSQVVPQSLCGYRDTKEMTINPQTYTK